MKDSSHKQLAHALRRGSIPGLRAAAIATVTPPRAASACACGGTCARCQTGQRTEDIVPAGPGRTLDPALRQDMEQRLGHDLSRVRLHADMQSARNARRLGAAAYTVGTHIVFAQGRYAPDSTPGRRLLVHELTHAVQQYDATPPLTWRMDAPDSAHERAAMASAMGGDGRAAATGSAMRVREQRIQRTPDLTKEEVLSPDPSIEGRTYVAPRCGANPDCTLSFQFQNVTTGTRPALESPTPSYWRGANVVISGRITPACGACQSLEMLQTIRNVTRGADGALSTVRPSNDVYARRAGYEDRNAPAETLGWAIDAHATSNQPLFTQSGHGMSGDTMSPAEITDKPGSFPYERNVGKQFNTYLLCVNGSQSIPLGYVQWGYWIDQDQNVRFDPAQPQPTCGASNSLFDAAARWNTFADLIHLDVDRGPAGPSP